MSNKFFRESRIINLLEKHLAPFEQSEEFGDVKSKFNEILMLGDRLLVACRNHPRLSQSHIKLTDSLKKLGDEGNEFAFIENAELFLKSILFVCFPEDYPTQQEEKKWRFDLHKVMQKLRLLSEQEIQRDLDDIDGIKDPIRRAFLQAKFYRNKLHDTSHDDGSDAKTKAEKVTACLILGSLFKFSKELKVKLRSLIVRDFPDDDNLESLLISKKEVWQQNVTGFGGREDILGSLLEDLTEDRPHFNLLKGGEGSGKTAVACKFTERVKLQSTAFLGSDAPSVQEKAPWLPGAVLYLGKCPGNLNDFTRCIIAQANTMLLEAISLPLEVSKEILSDGFIPQADEDKETLKESLKERQEKQDFSRNTDAARLQIGKALNQLFLETGQATLVVDALDELFERKNLLDVIPEELVIGSRCLVSGRGPVIAEFYARRRGINEIQIDNLSREDIPLVLGFDREQMANKDFIDEVYSRTGGLALAVRNTAEKIKKNKGVLSIDLIENESELWEKHLRDWEVHYDEKKVDALESLLPLFLFFECSGLALKNDELQSYLREQGISKRLRWIHDTLTAVDTQLVGVHSGNSKLQNHGFVDHCLKNSFSTHDLEIELAKILSWMCESLKSISPDTIATFCNYWYNASNYLEEKKSKPLFQTLINTLISDGDVLRKVIESIQKVQNTTKFIYEVIESGSDKNNIFCQCVLGSFVISSDLKRGEEILNKAISGGNLEAKYLLGQHLVFFCEDDRQEEGKELLLEAIMEGFNPNECSVTLALPIQFFAQVIMGGFFGVKADPENGKKVLEKLTEEGDLDATIMLAESLIDGEKLERNTRRGEEYFQLACKKNSTKAQRLLGLRYIDGKGVEKNIDLGLSLLERAIELDDAKAMYLLGLRKFKGENLERDLAGARELFLRSCNASFTPAMHFLGSELITGDNFKQDKAKGVELLNQAIDHDFIPAKTDLGKLLLEGKYLGQNIDKGKELINSVINDVRPKFRRERARARSILGCFLVDDQMSSSSDGEALLQEAINSGYQEALKEFGRRLLDGKNIEKDEAKGHLLLDLYETKQRPQDLVGDGINFYESSKQDAANSFLKAFRVGGAQESGNNLAYMMHRREVPESVEYPEIDTLLGPLIEGKHVFAHINYALCLAKGFQSKKNWRKADEIFGKLVEFGKDEDFAWWLDLTDKDDGDGHLVTGWLARYGITADPTNLSIEERLNLAKEKGFDVPTWMNERAVSAL